MFHLACVSIVIHGFLCLYGPTFLVSLLSVPLLSLQVVASEVFPDLILVALHTFSLGDLIYVYGINHDLHIDCLFS